jgi:prepilin-type N-terminal cleavage/methylation domain-containing protein
MKLNRRGIGNQAGFTLIEIAIVMVIIGLLIGGVLKGQEMISNAKVKKVMKQADEIRAAITSFYDKYGQFPGDENSPNFPPGADTTTGNNNGQISAAEAPGVFTDLVLANLISGTYNAANPYPTHPFGGTVRVEWVAAAARHRFFFTNMPANQAMEIDAKYDDGVWNTGSITGSAAYTAGTTLANFYIDF